MKLRNLIDCRGTLDTIDQLPIEAQTAWDIADTVDEARVHLKRFDDKYNELLKKFGTPDKDDPTKYEVKDTSGLQKELDELVDVDIKIVFPSFGIKVFNGTEVSALEIRGLRDLGILTKNQKR